MNTTLTITFKTGEAVAYPAGEWDDYSYDGTAVPSWGGHFLCIFNNQSRECLCNFIFPDL